MAEQIANLLGELIKKHPRLIGWAALAFGLATLINTGIKMTWTYAETPRWARFVLGFTMPLALNVYHLTEKVGVKEPTVPSEEKK